MRHEGSVRPKSAKSQVRNNFFIGLLTRRQPLGDIGHLSKLRLVAGHGCVTCSQVILLIARHLSFPAFYFRPCGDVIK